MSQRMPEVTWPLIQLNRILQPGPGGDGPWVCDMQHCHHYAEYAIRAPGIRIDREAYLPNSCSQHLGPLVAKVIHTLVTDEEELEQDISRRVIHVLGDDEP